MIQVAIADAGAECDHPVGEDAALPRERKLVGYCLRCGGDCFDDGQKNYHRCPPARASAAAIAAAKFACDKALAAAEARPWAKNLSESEYSDLKAALRELREALSKASA